MDLETFLAVSSPKQIISQAEAYNKLRAVIQNSKNGFNNSIRSVLVYGPNGCGKTSLLTSLSKEPALKKIVVEFIRNDNRLEQVSTSTRSIMGCAATNIKPQSVFSLCKPVNERKVEEIYENEHKEKRKEHVELPDVVILDDIDAFVKNNVSGKKYIHEYLNNIKKKKKSANTKREPDVKLPVFIIVCNEPFGKNFSDIKTKCEQLVKFTPLNFTSLRNVLNATINRFPEYRNLENIKQLVELSAKRCEGDARKALIELYFNTKTTMKKGSKVQINEEEEEEEIRTPDSIFTATNILFSDKVGYKQFGKYEKVINSDELMTFMIHENGLTYMNRVFSEIDTSREYDKETKWKYAFDVISRMNDFAEHLSYGDVMSTGVTRDGYWDLIPNSLWDGPLRASFEVKEAMDFYGVECPFQTLTFPRSIGVGSTTTHNNKEQIEFCYHHAFPKESKTIAKGNFTTLSQTNGPGEKIEFWNSVYHILVSKLLKGQIEEAVDLADSLNIKNSKEMIVIEKLYLVTTPSSVTYESVPQKTKTAFSKSLNALQEKKKNKKKEKKEKKENEKKEQKQKPHPEQIIEKKNPKKRLFSEAYEEKATKTVAEQNFTKSNIPSATEPDDTEEVVIVKEPPRKKLKALGNGDGKGLLQSKLMVFFNKKP